MKTNIIDIINMPFEEYECELEEKIEATPEYKETQQKFEELIKSLEKDKKIEIDSAATYKEVLSRDIAFNEGFKLAIKLILSAIN